MIRLLIVDDEELIVNGLYDIFTCLPELDLDVYKAYSGQEAVDWLNRTRMDIVLTDIRMPEMNGLQLLDEITARWPRCKVIFLTGHSEFDYIYQAAQHKDVDYILKTEDNDKVIAVVENAIQALKAEDANEALMHQAKQLSQTQADAMLRDFCLRLLTGDIMASAMTKQQFDAVGMPFTYSAPIALILGQVDWSGCDEDYVQQYQGLRSIRHMVVRQLATRVRSLVILHGGNRLNILVQPVKPDTDDIPQCILFIKGALESVQTACQDTLHFKVRFAHSDQFCAWAEIADRYTELSQLLHYRIGAEPDTLLGDGEFQNKIRSQQPQGGAMQADSKALENCLRRMNGKLAEQHLEAGEEALYNRTVAPVLDALAHLDNMHDPIALEAFQTIALLLRSYINRWKLHAEVQQNKDISFLSSTVALQSWQDAVKRLKDLAGMLFSLQDSSRKKRIDRTIAYIHSYIHAHLDGDLSLVALAEMVFLNPSYLSRLYKQETNMNLSEYIDMLRLEASKCMLRENKKRIHEISQCVGYDTSTSFTRFFKRGAGITPQEYRDQHKDAQMRDYENHW